MWYRFLPVLLLTASNVFAAVPAKPVPNEKPYQPLTWTNATDHPVVYEVTKEQALAMKGGAPVVVHLGRNDTPYRVWSPTRTEGGLSVTAPPKSKIELWSRADLAKQANHPFAQAARLGALPIVVLGPYAEEAGKTLDASRTEIAPWRTGPASFRAYPMGALPVTIRVTNDGTSNWWKPRARLFVPEDWKVEPTVADVKTVEGKPFPQGILKRKQTGIASFTVTAPKGTILDLGTAVFAFVRFNVGKQSVTVRNSVDAVMQEPITRRYAMDEKGTKFVVRLINPFAPARLGTPSLEIRKPTGAEWSVAPPKPVEVAMDVSAIAPLTRTGASDGQIAVPVVVTLNELRMGFTPIVQVAWRSGSDGPERTGLQRTGTGSERGTLSSEGLLPAAVGGSRVLSLSVPPRFAVSDPAVFVSPTWVTVKAIVKDATRVRLEYDAFGADTATVAGDYQIVSGKETQTFSFLLPDAAFTKRLTGGADIRLVFDGGDAFVQDVRVSKWNPEAK